MLAGFTERIGEIDVVRWNAFDNYSVFFREFVLTKIKIRPAPDEPKMNQDELNLILCLTFSFVTQFTAKF